VINEDALVEKAATRGASELAKKKGLELVFSETYPKGTADFSGILNQVKAAKPDVLVAASVLLEDVVAITRQMRELDLDVKLLSSLLYGALPDYYKRRPRSSSTAAPFGSRGFPTPETRSSSQRMSRSSTVLPPCSQPMRMPGASSLWRWCGRWGARTPTSSERRC
jgi:hypothetical protein